MPTLLDRHVGDLVAEDFRRARIFHQFGIDFCCGGGITVSEACRRKHQDASAVERALTELAGSAPDALSGVQSWSAAFLVDYIVSVHHTYVRESLPALRAFSAKVARVHGHARPELVRVAELVDRLGTEMEAHLTLEETVIFPAIRTQDPLAYAHIVQAESDHEAAAGLVRELRRITDGFQAPDWACNTYRALYVNLAGFERDLFTHVHLENNVLFKRVRDTTAQTG